MTPRVSELVMENFYQKIDYQYNIRGWLRSINNLYHLHSDSNGHFQDLFAFSISYNETTSIINGVKELYNGNISETFWRTSSDNVLRKYSYAYDDLNRLKNAVYQKPGMINPIRNTYDEWLSYDKNGNITSLTRTGDYDGELYAQAIDILAYAYDDHSNILRKVTDSTNSPLGFKDDSDGTNDTEDDYEYDANGNMISDQNKGITHIRYNHLNLPVVIEFEGTAKSITYQYNANGVKLKKVVNIGEPLYQETKTDYLGGFQYENNILQFFPHPEGYVKHTLDKNQKSTYDYVYNFTDHLGNIRLSYTLDPATNVLKILEENHYYPFGLKHTNYSSGKKSIVLEQITEDKKVLPVLKNTYDYKYNGKEWQDELGLNFYDYGARNYDPAIGRWMNIDPLAEQAPDWTPYRYGFNNPLRYNDPTGLSEEDWIPRVDDNGAVSYTAEKGDSAKSLSSQYGITQEKAEKITGTKGSEEIKEGTKVSGEKVKEVTGSEVLKLDATSKTMTDQDIVFQTLFAFRRERILDSQSSNPDFSANVNDYFKNVKQRMSGTAGGAEYGLTTNANKPTTLLIDGQKVSIHLSFSGINDGLFSTGYGKIQTLHNGNSNISFLHPSAYPSDLTKRTKITVPALNIVTNNSDTLLKYLKN